MLPSSPLLSTALALAWLLLLLLRLFLLAAWTASRGWRAVSIMLGLLLHWLLLELLEGLLLLQHLRSGWIRREMTRELGILLLRVGRHRMWLAGCTSSTTTALTLSLSTSFSLPLASCAASCPSATACTVLLSSPSLPSSWMSVAVEVCLIFAALLILVLISLI